MDISAPTNPSIAFRRTTCRQAAVLLTLATLSLVGLTGCGGSDSAAPSAAAPPAANLSISAVGSLDPIAAGGRLVYTIAVSNAGPATASSVVVTDTLPAEVTPVSTSGCTESPSVAAICSLGDIASGGSAQFTITVTVNAGFPSGTVTNTASVSSPQSANNTVSTATVVVPLGTVIGTQQFDIRRGLTRLFESAMGNLFADAMRGRYPGVDAAITNSGGLRADINCTPPSAGEADCAMTWGELFAVHPFGNRMVVETLTGAQLAQAFVNGFSPKCNVATSTGGFPQISGLKVAYHCDGANPVIDGMWRAPDGVGGALTPIANSDAVRIVTNDFLYAGGDGYAVFALGTNVQQPGEEMLKAVIDYIIENSPVGPTVDGRIVFSVAGL